MADFNDNLDLFLLGITPSGTQGQDALTLSIPEYLYFPEESQSIVGSFDTGKNVIIELWRDGNSISLLSPICNEIGNTGRYSWSISNLSNVPAGITQYHYRMTDEDQNSEQGDFILVTLEGKDGAMPSLKNKTSYINII